MLIKDLVPGVVRKLRQRDDLAEVIPIYLKKAIIDITQNYEFDELRHTGPTTNFVQGQAEYPRDFFTLPSHGYATFIVSWFVYFSTSANVSNSTSSANPTGKVMKYRQPRVVDPLTVIPGLPSVYSQVGEQVNQGNILVGYNPDQAYATYQRYQREHPFPQVDENSPKGAQVLAQQHIYMPNDWQDILEYAAAEKACDDIGMLDVGTLFHQKIYGSGNSANGTKKMPGLITERMTQQQRQSDYNERQLKLRVRRY